MSPQADEKGGDVVAEVDHRDQVSPQNGSTNVTPQEDAHVTFKVWVVVCIVSIRRTIKRYVANRSLQMSWGYGISFVPVPFFAAVGTEVATELGNPADSAWFIPAWIISITTAFMIAGSNTDMLGRRWFLIIGQAVCFVGHLITGLAKSNAQIIAGMTIQGFGAALCQMAAFALPELLPNKWRAIGVVLADFGVYICIILIPVTARYGYYEGDWRANFYSAAALQALSAAGLYFFYYPPAHPLGIPFRTAFKQLDYLGMLLFTAGAVPVMVGIVYTASLPASNPRVLGPLIAGFIILIAFGLWETFGNARHPLTPPAIFARGKGRDFTAPCIALAIINMFYYSSSIIWPTMINAFYTLGGQPWQRAAVLSLPQGIAITGGAVGLTFLGPIIKNYHWQQTAAVTCMVVFGSLLALATPTNMGLMCAFLVLSLFGYGWAIYLSIAFTQLGVDQENLGISGGLSGCVRFAGGTVAQAVYLTVFSNDLTKKTPEYVMAAATKAGVPASQLTDLLKLLATPTVLASEFGATVAAAVGLAQQEAIAHGIKLIAYTSLGFGCVGIVACLCCRNIDSRMDNTIEVFLENDEFADRNKFH